VTGDKMEVGACIKGLTRGFFCQFTVAYLYAAGWTRSDDCEHMLEEILPHPVEEHVRYEAGDAPRDIEQREPFGGPERLARARRYQAR
jgi:hypothetical protein